MPKPIRQHAVEGRSMKLLIPLQVVTIAADGTRTTTVVATNQVSSLTWSLFDLSGNVINSRTAVDIKSTITANGEAVVMLTGDDNCITATDDSILSEVHLLMIDGVGSVGGTTWDIAESFWITVDNRRGVTA